jgi:hypothetical protein
MSTELVDILRQHGRLSVKQLNITEVNFKYSKNLPKTPDFNVNILNNSGVATPMGLRLKSWGDVGTPIYGKGDSLGQSKVIEWICENWSEEKIRLRCRDLMSDEKKYQQRYILKTPEIAMQISRWILDDVRNLGNYSSDDF